MKKPVFTGSSVAIITPFLPDGTIHFEELGKIIDNQIAAGTAAITICGTTGEASALHDDEHRAAIEFTVKHVAGRVPVIAGAGSNHTDYAIELTQFSKAAGADAVLSVTPYYNKTTQKGLIAHFTAIADSADIPVILYNVPSRTGISFTTDTYVELSKHPGINGVKEASGNFSLIAQAMAACGENLNFWSGNDDQIVPLMSLGGLGVISVLANVAPKATHDIAAACLKGDYKEGARLQLEYFPLIDALFTEVNPIPVKAGMRLLGWETGGLRMPLVDIGEGHLAQLKQEMDALGLTK